MTNVRLTNFELYFLKISNCVHCSWRTRGHGTFYNKVYKHQSKCSSTGQIPTYLMTKVHQKHCELYPAPLKMRFVELIDNTNWQRDQSFDFKYLDQSCRKKSIYFLYASQYGQKCSLFLYQGSFINDVRFQGGEGGLKLLDYRR